MLLYSVYALLIVSAISCTSVTHYQPAVNDPLLVSTEQNSQISLLSYNIQAIFGKDQDKLDALLDYIDEEAYDFVVFQELFDEQAREYIMKKVNPLTYRSIVARVDYDSFPESLFQDAGLFLMSKYPQVDLSGIMLDDEVTVSNGAVHMILTKELSISTDFLANKSVLGSLHQISDSSYIFLFTTHVQAIGSRRQKRRQFAQIKNFIDYAVHRVLESGMVKSSGDLSVLLAGDFNTDAYDDKDINILSSELGFPRDLHSERNPLQKEYTLIFKTFNFYKRFDYIWAYDSLGNIPLNKLEIQSINATDVTDKDNDSVSDHMALKASLIINKTSAEGQMGYQAQEGRAK